MIGQDSRAAELEATLSPVLGGEGLELVDVEVAGGTVRVTVDRAGGVGLDELAVASRAVSALLDDVDPLPGRYTLEVSSPGVERPLRTPEQFSRAVGQTVALRLRPGAGEVRRYQGRLAAVESGGVVVEGPTVPGGSIRVGFETLERARTVFEWGADKAPSPSRGKGRAATPPGRGKGRADKGRERVRTPS